MNARLRFVREMVTLPDGRLLGETFAADQWLEQELFVPAFAQTEDGLPRYRLVYFEAPRGHFKTGGIGAVALAEVALAEASTEVLCVAGDRDQAALILAAIDGYVARNPDLAGLLRVRGDERIIDETASRIRVLSSDAPTSWGTGGLTERYRLICDELTHWPSDALWSALASSTGKTPDTQTLVVSNAGFAPGHSWQWGVREAAGAEAWAHLYAAPGIVASWISVAWVDQMRSLLPASVFSRVVENVWSSGAGDFCSEDQWRSCVDESLRPSRADSRLNHRRFVAGLDLGLVRDRSALVIVHREGGRVVLDELEVWEGTREEPVSIAMVERALIDASKRFPGLLIVCDPWQLKSSVERLRAGQVRIEEFTFSSGSVGRLSSVLHSAITSATLRVFPDAELEREILGLRVVESAAGWRFDHRAGGFSDRAVALGMAVQEALKLPENVSRPMLPPAPARIWTELGYVYGGTLTGGFVDRPM